MKKLAWLALWIAGCSSSPARDHRIDGGDAEGGLPCNVEQLLVARCTTCHSATPTAAPMPLLTYADLVAPSKSDPSRRVVDVALERVAGKTMPPGAALAADDVAVLRTWIATGTPRAICVKADAGAATWSDASGPECAQTSDCPGALVCRNGACDVECKADVDCTDGASCIDTRCQTKKDTASYGDFGMATRGRRPT